MRTSIHVWIPDGQTWIDFKAFVFDKKGKNHQATGRELERSLKLVMALEGWMDYAEKINFIEEIRNPNSTDHNTHSNRESKLIDSFNKIYFPVHKISQEELSEFIKDTLNVIDKRTVDNWIGFMKKERVIYKATKRSKDWSIRISKESRPDYILNELSKAEVIVNEDSRAALRRN
jgi:hypothetical protein